jgi:uncharacterized RDD family membrane protein YckC
MIKITCPSCGFSKDIDENNIPESSATILCPVCMENFSFSAYFKKKAGIVARGLAAIIDFLLLNAVNLVISLALDIGLSRLLNVAGIDDDFSYKIVGGVIYFFWIASMFMYFTFATYRYGRTIGKKILGIMVVGEDGGIPGIEQCFKREVLGKILSSLTVGIGFLWAVFDKNHQALHDKLAKTFVVYV